jgi:hypothetical protein
MILCKICNVYIAGIIIIMTMKTIAISEANYELLKDYGRAGDSFDDVITNLVRNKSKRDKRPQSDNRPSNQGLTAASTSSDESKIQGDVAYG